MRVADLDDLPDDGNRYEVLNGELVTTPMRDVRHQGIVGALLVTLSTTTTHRVLARIGVLVPDGALIPDVAVTRMDIDLNTVWYEPSDVALVIEIEPVADGKQAAYAAAGILNYWQVARDGTLRAYALSTHYERIAEVRPGEVWAAHSPFDVAVGALRLAD